MRRIIFPQIFKMHTFSIKMAISFDKNVLSVTINHTTLIQN